MREEQNKFIYQIFEGVVAFRTEELKNQCKLCISMGNSDERRRCIKGYDLMF
jgi:hypothetical protein